MSDAVPTEPDAARVAIFEGEATYPQDPPFSPSECYPEYPFGPNAVGPSPNHAYHAVREGLRLLGLDLAHFGTAEWNPFRTIVQPGQTVLIKPNFVREFRETQPGHGDCTMTHGSVIRAVADYAFLALDGRGRIVIADAPQDDADFDAIRAIAGLDTVKEFYAKHSSLPLEVHDLRLERDRKVRGVIVSRTELPGDPAGYINVNLGSLSAFTDIEPLCGRLYGSDYDTVEIRRHHRTRVHEYLISRTALTADCVIEVPKLKTHKKVGVTANMKLLVGLCGNKNWVAHYRVGTPAQGGDQFADNGARQRLEGAAVGTFKKAFPFLGPLRRVAARPLRWAGELAFGRTENVIRSGNWYGNDTAWRMAHDLYRILLYADTSGGMNDSPQRAVFSVVDGIVGGEGDGPLDATPKPAGVVIAGPDPAVVDHVCARVMGFDSQSTPTLREACRPHRLPLARVRSDDISVVSNASRFSGSLVGLQGRLLAFEPHFGWTGRVEVDSDTSVPACAE